MTASKGKYRKANIIFVNIAERDLTVINRKHNINFVNTENVRQLSPTIRGFRRITACALQTLEWKLAFRNFTLSEFSKYCLYFAYIF